MKREDIQPGTLLKDHYGHIIVVITEPEGKWGRFWAKRLINQSVDIYHFWPDKFEFYEQNG